MTDETIPAAKCCRKCGELKEVRDFARHSRHKDGLQENCRVCVAAHGVLYRAANKDALAKKKTDYYFANRSAIRQKHKTYYEGNKDQILASQAEYERKNRAQVRVRQANYRAKNRSAFRARHKAYAERYPERVLASNMAWRSRNPEAQAHLYRTEKSKRRARERNAPGTHTPKQTAALFQAQGGLCANPFCRTVITAKTRHLDHMTPLSRGGSNDIANLQFTCVKCNQRKHTMTQEEWLEKEMRRNNVISREPELSAAPVPLS